MRITVSRRATYPWLRSVEESVPRKRRPAPRLTRLETVVILVVVTVIVAMAVWFVFFSSKGLGPGTV